MRLVWPLFRMLLVAASVALVGCDTPHTAVVFQNDYPGSAAAQLVVYRAFWEATSLQDPLLPGARSDPLDSVAASPSSAYVLLAPGWDPASSTPPTSLIVLQSTNGFELHFNDTLRIVIDDSAFAGSCAAGSFLSQDQADFITQRVFASDFAALTYDAATCTTRSARP